MNAIDLLKRQEGFRSAAYQDSEGYWTIGYGILIDARKGGGITEAEADQLLRNRVTPLFQQLSGLEWYRALNEPRQAVIISMAYQLGIAGLFAFRRMIAALAADNPTAAAAEILDSKAAKQTPGRYQQLHDLMLAGEWPTED